MTPQKNRIVCGMLPEEDVVEFLVYARELVKGVEAGSFSGKHQMRRIVATGGYERHVKTLIGNWKKAKEEEAAAPITWQCGVTTVLSRQDLLVRTLVSIRDARFPKPDIFVDGVPGGEAYFVSPDLCERVHYRTHNIKTYSHWLLTLIEMYLRNSRATYYVMFQDDLVLCKGVREYLETFVYPNDGYLNLYTALGNDRITVTSGGERVSTKKEYKYDGWHDSNQLGQGGLCFVFDNKSVVDMLATRHVYERMWDVQRRHRYMDGAVVTAMASIGRREIIHVPSLVQHTGHVSSMGNNWTSGDDQATTFRGESWNCLELIKGHCDGNGLRVRNNSNKNER
jgi:hypothetical protein